MQQIYEELQELRAEVKTIKLELTRYKGFVDGLLWVGGLLSAAAGAVWGYLHKNQS